MSVECCNGCVPPKRHLHCHSTCKEYKDAVDKHIEEQKAKRTSLAVAYEVNSVRTTKDSRAKHRKRRGRLY